MISYHVLAALAAQRREVFVAEADLSRHARQARLHRRRPASAGVVRALSAAALGRERTATTHQAPDSAPLHEMELVGDSQLS
jgi:hypothetical protein